MEKRLDDSSSGEIRMTHQENPTKGGLITMPFIIANEAFERVASYGLLPNMILYLMKDYRFSLAKGTNLIFFWAAATNFLPLVGAFISDSYLGRFRTIAFGSICSFFGMTILWLTAMIPQARPSPCDPTIPSSCTPTSSAQTTMLISSFVLISIGAGGIRPCSLAFGADQLDKRGNSNNERVLERYFGWYYASASLSVVIALTGIVYIQDHLGWKIGFGVPALLMLFSALLFILASPLYVKMKASTSLFSGFAQVIVVSYKNRKLALPPRSSDGWYHHKGLNLIAPTDKLRFLNKACIIRNPEQDIAPDGSATDAWNLCTVEQVEELKALIKVIPLWSTGIMMSVNTSQGSFQLMQANSMDRHVTSNFQIPAGSYVMFVIITLTLWIVLYDRAILPLASKIRGKPVRIGVKLRMGIGLLFTSMAMLVSGIIEDIRRKKANKEGYGNNGNAVVDMSAMWLAPQHCLNGLAEAFTAIAQTEFYYSQFPKSMSSIASCLFGLGMAVGSVLASFILSMVDDLTSRNGKESWVSNNINKAHYDYYYWLLAIMSIVNVFYYIICSWLYGCCEEKETQVCDERIEWKGEELSNLGSKVRDEGDDLGEEDVSKLKEF